MKLGRGHGGVGWRGSGWDASIVWTNRQQLQGQAAPVSDSFAAIKLHMLQEGSQGDYFHIIPSFIRIKSHISCSDNSVIRTLIQTGLFFSFGEL